MFGMGHTWSKWYTKQKMFTSKTDYWMMRQDLIIIAQLLVSNKSIQYSVSGGLTVPCS